MFEGIKTKMTARKAYALHVQGNQLIDRQEIAQAREKHQKALELYEQAYEGGMRDPQVLRAYAVLLMRFDRAQEARKVFLECEKLMSNDPKMRKELRVNFAVCQWKLGELDNAIENMESAASNGMTAMIYTTLGFFYIEKAKQTGDFTKAIEFNNQAMEYDEEDAGILDNMGQMYYFMGEHDKAYEYFAKAYTAKPTQVASMYYIAKINLERGNLEKAQAFIEACEMGNFSALATVSHEQVNKLKEEILAAAH
ncbi:MAG: hypothetical protein IJM56_05445 [Clostridia bacterium]|nr:hypothetical protein [Clostridia bacterium]MBQ9407951.1 hypothetical protein [Clostridia bacterium]